MILPADARAMQEASFWLALAPELSVGGHPNGTATRLPEVLMDMPAVAACLHEDGYFCYPTVFSTELLTPLRTAMGKLHHAGIPPVFIYIYDEPWRLFGALSPLIEYLLGERFALLPNFWAWNIPLEVGARGWPPHQDCQTKTRFTGSGDPEDEIIMSISLWLPLSDATLHNGCMSVLPRALSDQVPPGEAPPPEMLAQGTPLPVVAGSVLGWTQDLYHWSNMVTDQAAGEGNEPRMSLSLEFQNPAFEPLAEPLLTIRKPPAFSDRLKLIARQIPRYRHMERLSFDMTALLDNSLSVG